MFQCFIAFNLKILLVLVVFGFIMGKARQSAWKVLSHRTGGCLILDFFNLIGTPVHELSHLLPGLLFGYRVEKICLYRRVKTAAKNGGALGFVKMSHRGKTRGQKLQKGLGPFFIGVGPLFLPPIFLFFLSALLPASLRTLPASFGQGMDSFFKALHQLSSTDIIIMFAYLYVIIGVSLNMELSRQDLHTAWKGLLLLECLFFLLSAMAVLFHWNLSRFIDFLFHWNILIASIGTIFGLSIHLLSLISSE